MCLAISYFLPALFLAAASADHFTDKFNQQQLQRPSQLSPYMTMQDLIQEDQQNQASQYDYHGQDNFGSQDINEGSHNFASQHEGGHNFGSQFDGGHNFGSQFDGGHNFGQEHKQYFPVHQHVHEESPEPIKHYKEVVVPVHKNVEFKVHQPVLIPVPHPVPIHVPVPKAIVIPVIKEVSIPVEKSVPYPVTKEVRVPKIKEVPFEVVKHIIVPVEKPFPFKVPVYETIIHTKKGQHKI